MSCPTCDHTMHPVFAGIYWCPRCGTMRLQEALSYTPKLVRRVIEFGDTLKYEDAVHIANFEDLGLRESVTKGS